MCAAGGHIRLQGGMMAVDDADEGGGEACATLVLEGLPLGTTLVLDQHVFHVRGVCRGVRDLPAGPHLVATAAGGALFPAGFFFVASPGEVVVRRWNAAEERLEELGDADAADAAAARVVADPEALARMLRYQRDAWLPSWRALSSHITAETVARVSPVRPNLICVGDEPDAIQSSGGGKPSRAEQALDAQLDRGRAAASVEAAASSSSTATASHARSGGGCFYARIPTLKSSSSTRGVKGGSDDMPALTGAALTAAHLDRSDALDVVCASIGGFGELVGELQFAFVAFCMCQSLAGFDHWRRLLGLCLGCERAATSHDHQTLYVALLHALIAQIEASCPCSDRREREGGEGGSPKKEGGGLLDGGWAGEGEMGGWVADALLLGGAGRPPLLAGFVEVVRHSDCVPCGVCDGTEALVAVLRRRLGEGVVRDAGLDGEGRRLLFRRGAHNYGGGDHYDEEDEYAPVVVVCDGGGGGGGFC